MRIPVVQGILNANDRIAAENRALLDKAGVFVLNLMASPGAGKTTLILATVALLPEGMRPAVIEGDLASRIDADTIAARGIPVVQINTGGNCHLDAPMVGKVFPDLPLAQTDILFIENVGNLVCPAEFALGEDIDVVVASVPEGHDKPHKYPSMFAKADVVLLNKADMIDVFDFDLAFFQRGVQMLKPDMPVFVVSSKTGQGIDAWLAWLLAQRATARGGA